MAVDLLNEDIQDSSGDDSTDCNASIRTSCGHCINKNEASAIHDVRGRVLRHIAPPRTTGKDCERRLKCFEKVNDMQRLEILQSYNSFDDRKLQNNYLNCCIETQPTTRKRPRNGDRVTGKGSKSFTYTFTVKPNAPKITVCPSAFMSLHGIGRTRLKVIRGPATTLPLMDMRGRHNNHYSLPAAIKIQIHDHIKSFPKRESHYSQHDDNNRRIYHAQYICPVIFFYSKMLWTDNFGLHGFKSGDAIMHLWSEAGVGRGSSEVHHVFVKHCSQGMKYII
ncbi:hypothetical protein RRG08_029314 [Elysia crispata]|uniref:Uncharacterized protein n=1 Tax=Elysia crispata TaxID=231223 RepID=A0AAE1DT22_9GAST|nr:hypothetical protein RRG08_029314 [Elysia crispata]